MEPLEDELPEEVVDPVEELDPVVVVELDPDAVVELDPDVVVEPEPEGFVEVPVDGETVTADERSAFIAFVSSKSALSPEISHEKIPP